MVFTIRIAGAVLACAHTAVSAAPELLINGGGEQPVGVGWNILAGNARTTGLIRGPSGSVFAPDQGFGYLVLGPGTSCEVTQTGEFPFGSERLFLTAQVRTPGDASMRIVLRAFDVSGQLDVERTAIISGLETWTETTLTYAIPAGSRTWDITIVSDQPGQVGIHADALTLIGTCVADINGDRLINFFDVTTYLALFQAGDPEADLTGNGTIDFFDISELLDSFQFICE